MVIVTLLIVVAGLATIIWMANWPFGTPWEKDLDEEQRRIHLAHNRRHHRGAAIILLPILAFGFAISSIQILLGPKSDHFAVAVMGVCSAVCVGVFVRLVKGKRGRRL